MMDEPAHTLQRIAASVERSHGGVILRPWCADAQALEVQMSTEREVVETQIATYIYANYYAFNPSLLDVTALDHMVLLGVRQADPAFFARLRSANPGEGYFSPGWTVLARSRGGELRVQKDGISLIARADYHLSPHERSAHSGDVVAIRFPKDATFAAPGFYVAYANAGPAAGPSITRIYLNLQADYAVKTMHLLLSQLLALGVPYTFKVIANPVGFMRRDNTVLYIARADYSAIALVVCGYQAAFPEAFGDLVPSFTLPLRPGVAVADDPCSAKPDELSFGEHRSRLIAEAICNVALGKDDCDTETLYQAILARFEAEGIDPLRLYLHSAAAEDYETVP